MSKDAPTTAGKKSPTARLLRPKVVIPLFLLFLILISPILIRGWYLSHVPDFPEPFDPTPLLEYSIPDDENAMNGYRSAMTLFVQPTSDVRELRDEIGIDRLHLPNDDIERFLMDNEPSLLAWKQAATKEKSLYIPASDYDLLVSLDLVQDLREIQRTVMLLCMKLQAEGKAQEAWDWYRASIRASRHIGENGGITERLVGVAYFQSSGSHLINWAAEPTLTSEDLRLALHQFQDDWKLTEKTSTALKLEYLGLMKMIDLTDRESWDYQFDIKTPKALLYLKGEPELSRRILRFYFFDLLRSCDLPRSERQKIASEVIVNFDGIEWSNEEFSDALYKSPIAVLVLPATSVFQTAIDREEVRYRCLLVALAAQAYFRDHGEFPTDATALVPEYLSEVPDDVFSPTPAPLIYRRDGEGAVVYSRFENGVDDGGTEVAHEERAGDELLDYGYRIRNPEKKPLRAPKPSAD